MRKRNTLIYLLILAALLSACNLNLSGATSTPGAVTTPTTPLESPVSPTSAPESPTPAPATATPTFPPVITATPQPATATPAVTQTSPPGVKIDVIKMIDVDSGWAVGQYLSTTTDDILKTADGGISWKVVTPPEPNRNGKHAVAFFLDASHAWVNYSAQPSGSPPTTFSVWRTTDGGASWTPVSTSLSGLTMEYFTTDQIGFSDANHGWLMSVLGAGMNHTYFAIYTTSDGGASWTQVVSPDKDNADMACSKSGVWFRDADHGLLSGNCYGVIKGLYLYATGDGGETWTLVSLPAPASMSDAFTSETTACGADAPYFFDSSHGILTVTCATMNDNQTSRWIYRTSDGGTSWSSSPMPRPYGGYFFLTPQKGWYLGQTDPAAYSGVNVYQTGDGGQNWNKISGTQWGGVLYFVDANNGWVIAKSDSGQAFVRTYNGGLSYALLTPHLAP